jgi:hypothetical protein
MSHREERGQLGQVDRLGVRSDLARHHQVHWRDSRRGERQVRQLDQVDHRLPVDCRRLGQEVVSQDFQVWRVYIVSHHPH